MDTPKFLAAYRTWAATHLPGKEAEALLGLTDAALLGYLRSAEMGEGWTDRAIGALLTVQATGGYGRIPDVPVLRGLGLITAGPPYLLTADGVAWLAQHQDDPVERPVPNAPKAKAPTEPPGAGPRKGRGKTEGKPKAPSKRRVKEPDEADGPPPVREVVAVLPVDFIKSNDEEIADHLAAQGMHLDEAYLVYKLSGQEFPLTIDEFGELFEGARPKLIEPVRKTMRFVPTHDDAETDHPVLVLSLREGWLVIWETSDQEMFWRYRGIRRLPDRFMLRQMNEGSDSPPPVTDDERLVANPLDEKVREGGALRLPINTVVVLPDGADPGSRFIITRNHGEKYEIYEIYPARGRFVDRVKPEDVAVATNQHIVFSDYTVRDGYEASFAADGPYRALAYTQVPVGGPPLRPDANPLDYPLPLYIEATLGLRREEALEDWDKDVEEAEKTHHRALVRALLSKGWEKTPSAPLRSWVEKVEKKRDEFGSRLQSKDYENLTELERVTVAMRYSWVAFGFVASVGAIAQNRLLAVGDEHPDLAIADVPVLVNVLDSTIEVLTPTRYRRYANDHLGKGPIDDRASTPELFARMAGRLAAGPLVIRQATRAELEGEIEAIEWAPVEPDDDDDPELRGPPAAFTRKAREIGLAWLEERRMESNQSHRQTSMFG